MKTEVKKVKVVVEWFDAVNGIGCGIDSKGRKIALNAFKILPDGRFKTLKKDEPVMCELADNDTGGLYAKTIKRKKPKKLVIERDTFLPPRPPLEL